MVIIGRLFRVFLDNIEVAYCTELIAKSLYVRIMIPVFRVYPYLNSLLEGSCTMRLPHDSRLLSIFVGLESRGVLENSPLINYY